MRPTRRPLWCLLVSLMISAILSAWADGQFALAATSAKPQGTVIVAFHSFSKEVMDPALDGTPGLPYRGQMFDWFIKDIQRQTELAILFITHDFGVVARMCDRVAVMYAGKIVETAPTWELFDHPAHPYAEALLNSVPDVRLGTKRLYAIEGYPPSIYDKPPGCPFAPRCPVVMPQCQTAYPPEVEVAPGHTTSCWRHV